jgi:hypothetical protein
LPRTDDSGRDGPDPDRAVQHVGDLNAAEGLCAQPRNDWSGICGSWLENRRGGEFEIPLTSWLQN